MEDSVGIQLDKKTRKALDSLPGETDSEKVRRAIIAAANVEEVAARLAVHLANKLSLEITEGLGEQIAFQTRLLKAIGREIRRAAEAEDA